MRTPPPCSGAVFQALCNSFATAGDTGWEIHRLAHLIFNDVMERTPSLFEDLCDMQESPEDFMLTIDQLPPSIEGS